MQEVKEIKVVILGSAGVGKTCFIKRINGEDFEKKYISTIGGNQTTVNYDLGSYGNYKFNICDTAGQEKFSGNYEDSIKDSSAAIIMFDMTSRTSFKQLGYWVKIAKEVCPDISIHFVGNKCDEKDIKITKEQIFKFLDAVNLSDSFNKISTKTCKNLNNVFLKIIGSNLWNNKNENWEDFFHSLKGFSEEYNDCNRLTSLLNNTNFSLSDADENMNVNSQSSAIGIEDYHKDNQEFEKNPAMGEFNFIEPTFNNEFSFSKN